MNRLYDRYMELYNAMIVAKDSEIMKLFGESERDIFLVLSESNPELAEKWLGKLEISNWNNYLSESEAREIVSRLVHQDGRLGERWCLDEITETAHDTEGEVCEPPYYNEWALYATMNMFASDHWNSLISVIDEQDMARVIFKMSVETLKDPDRKRFVRDYFGL